MFRDAAEATDFIQQYGLAVSEEWVSDVWALISWLVKKRDAPIPLYQVFYFHSKAFDKVKYVNLFQIQNELDIDGKELWNIINLFWEQEAAVK